ncbi:UDP-N-acetyl glucosamine 2-epimerase [Rhizocola hellebori]|uniref:UDP-N-acetylglucosamine 2-epimerase (non-hydrolyzing) n=1 Tax=Rhizocola hellebori TaxID=1392758 RepID=A0A8J3Q509_9ACTN|nr:UDP-N-acetylglucosamine 2-epimerase (non-hydrolyzing) [Rhizocola hellebori]GIH03442.1 UDP-N-acetyl glucosamine 2-epimerase [Rhizocola hellebori]
MTGAEVLLLVGTRPEAVKVAPVALALAAHPSIRPLLVHSGQHGSIVRDALAPFGLWPDESLEVKRSSGSQAELMAGVLPRLDELLVRRAPDAVLVQGDTTTTLAGALAAYWRRIPVVHLEAGLRTGNRDSPFPEEGNRQLVARIASLHLAPTVGAAQALQAESVPAADIVVTGNTVVDAIQHMALLDRSPVSPQLAAVEKLLDGCGGRMVLITLHRRESWGAPMARMLAAIRQVVDEHPDLHALLPMHPNPAVREQLASASGHPRIQVIEPLDYPDLVRALRRSALVLTDSGGIQEEAPSFGVPVLVLREVTERPEAIDAGCAWLVGTDPVAIVKSARRLLAARRRLRIKRNPFGDGMAAARVVSALERLLARRLGDDEAGEDEVVEFCVQ